MNDQWVFIVLISVFLWLVAADASNFRKFVGKNQTSKQSNENVPQILPYNNWAGKRLLFVYAHIDDMEASSGGLIVKLAGIADIHLLILTNGDKGCGNPDLCGNSTNAELTVLRQTEQINSASILGIKKENIYFLSYEDCQLPTYPVQDLQQEIVANIRRVQPDVIITWDPQPYLDMIPSQGWDDMGYHPDHQLSGQLTLDSVWLAKLKRAWPHLGPAWKVQELYFWAFSPSRIPNFYLDVTGSAYSKKQESFLAMHSQYLDPNDVTSFLDFIGDQVAKQVGLPEGSKAEAYNFILW